MSVEREKVSHEEVNVSGSLLIFHDAANSVLAKG